MAFSNSPLVTYTNISPNKTCPRNHAIDTVTIHCVVGQWTAKQICDHFSRSAVEASCNYGVGKDGSIGLCVEEKDRSWCSSNRANDHRAITIEVASDTTHPYAVTDEAYNALIELLADICERNNIKELKWKADKSLIGQTDLQNMTVHRWFANKACPGDYLYSRHSEIAALVNERLSNSGGVDDEPATDEEYIWNYLMSGIGNAYGVAGLMGNLYAESALRPNNLQNSFEQSLGYTDESYTSAVDDGSYSRDSFVNDSAGYGLAQWTYSTRKAALYDMYKNDNYPSIGDLTLALDYLSNELEGDFPAVLEVLRNAQSVREASDIVLHDFESPANQSVTVEKQREEYSIYYFNKYAGNSGDDSDSESEERIKGKLSTLLLLAIGSE